MPSKDALNDARIAAAKKPKSNFTYGSGSVPDYQAPVQKNIATLTPQQYPTKVIVDRYGNSVETYTSGPLAGTSKTTGELVIQADSNISAQALIGDTGSRGVPVGGAPATPTSSRELIRQTLVDLGFPTNIIDGSISFVQGLIDDGDFTNDVKGFEGAVQILYNFKDFTTKKGNKLTSPFYTEFTSLGEGLVGDKRKSPKYLMDFALGVKDLVAKTGFSTKFASQDSLKKYVQNGVRITDLDERFAAATLKTAEADPNNVKALQAMGFINSAQDLKDFYADPEIGQDELNRRRTNVAFAKQAIKRADSGIAFDKTRIEQLAAGSGNELDAETTAAAGYETIAQQLNPLTKLEGIYGRRAGDYAGKSDTAIRSGIQTMLEEEQFRGTASELRKRRKEQEELAFQARPGTIGATRLSGGSLGGKNAAGLL
jgi:hypothetical protein